MSGSPDRFHNVLLTELYNSESRNREVASLGVTFVLVPEGVNRRIFEKGLADWRAAREKAERGETGSSDGGVFVERRKGKKGR